MIHVAWKRFSPADGNISGWSSLPMTTKLAVFLCCDFSYSASTLRFLLFLWGSSVVEAGGCCAAPFVCRCGVDCAFCGVDLGAAPLSVSIILNVCSWLEQSRQRRPGLVPQMLHRKIGEPARLACLLQRDCLGEDQTCWLRMPMEVPVDRSPVQSAAQACWCPPGEPASCPGLERAWVATRSYASPWHCFLRYLEQKSQCLTGRYHCWL